MPTDLAGKSAEFAEIRLFMDILHATGASARPGRRRDGLVRSRSDWPLCRMTVPHPKTAAGGRRTLPRALARYDQNTTEMGAPSGRAMSRDEIAASGPSVPISTVAIRVLSQDRQSTADAGGCGIFGAARRSGPLL